MAPVNQLGVLAFASAVLAVPHAQFQPFKRHAHPGAPPAYGSPSSPYYPTGGSSWDPVSSSWSSSAPPYPTGSAPSSAWGTGYPSTTSGSPIPTSSSYPECWSKCFQEAGITSESALCGNTEVDQCICDTCSPEEDKAYWTWYESFCPATSHATPTPTGPTTTPVSPVTTSPIPTSSSYPECWSECFQEAGITSESALCGNTEVDQCIQDKCSAAEDKAYWSWYESFCPSTSSGAAPAGSAPPYPVSSGSGGWGSPSGYAYPSGGWGSTGGPVSYSTCTETSTLIWKSTTAYSTYYVTHTLYPVPAGSEAAPTGTYGSPAGSAPAYNAVPAASSPVSPASEAPAYGGSPAGAAPSGETCAPDVTVTTTVQTTVTVTAGGAGGAPSGGAPTGGVPTGSAAAPSSTPTCWTTCFQQAGITSESALCGNTQVDQCIQDSCSAADDKAYWAWYDSFCPAASGSAAPSYPASSASSDSPAPSYTAPSTGGATGKRGIAYNDASLANSLAGGPASGWAYNWLSDSSGLDSSIPYIPMLWGPTDDFTSTWEANAKAGIAAGAQYLFAFNEPDMASQSNLSPEAAAAAWKQYMEPFAGQAKLVAPSVTNGQGDGIGLSWLTSFLEACSGCTIDAVAMHWYYAGNPFDTFQEQISQVASSTGKGIWLSEFGADGSDEDKSSFLAQALPWLDSNDSILGYSYFMVADGSLMDGSSPSTWGAAYCSS